MGCRSKEGFREEVWRNGITGRGMAGTEVTQGMGREVATELPQQQSSYWLQFQRQF